MKNLNDPLEDELTSQQGFVAFLDILGYQSFLEKNPAVDSALAVLKIINDIPAQQGSEFGESWMKNETNLKDIAAEVQNSCRHLIFSDTIVISVTHPEDASQKWQRAALAYICMFSARVAGVMFMNGLPVRGAIAKGSFVSVESCLAGSAVVSAYRLCSELDYSGVVLSEDISKVYNTEHRPLFKSKNGKFTPTYLSPLKGATEKHFQNLNWVTMLHESYRTELLSDISGTVHRSFWGHNKDIPLSADRKLSNTIKAVLHLHHCC